jgi:ATP-binding cassette subfamily B protein
MVMGGGMFGGGGGGGMFPGRGSAANPGGGLPFAGIPSELRAGVDQLLAEEPEHPAPTVTFSYQKAGAAGERLSLRALLLEHWQLGVLAAVLVAIVSVFNQLGPALISTGINRGLGVHKDMQVIVVVSLLYIAAVVVTAIAQRFLVQVTGRLAAWVMNDLRVKVFAHLQRLSLDFYTDEKAGVIISRMTSDIENLQQLLQDGLAQFAVQGLTMVVITGILLWMNVKLALITIFLVIPVLTLLSLWFRARSEQGYDRVRDGIANVLADLSETLHGVRIVTAHNRQRHNVLHHRNVVGSYRDANLYTAQINAVYGPGTQLIGYLGQAALLGVGGVMVKDHQLSVGALVAFFLYLNRFFAPMQLLVQQYNLFQQSTASITKLQGLLSTEPSVPESDDAVVLPPIDGAIELDHVTFGYNPDQPVLHDVSIRIAPGETVAFVGPTGAGKSTVAKLVTRFYDVTEGRVLIDGYDLRDVEIGSLRRQLGVVPQEPFLFSGTIRDNIAFARPEATDEEVLDSLRAVGLSEVIGRMPEGIHTVVHERGQSLSSGERQLIALARAFHTRPRVLVLDEATSNLDLRSEAKIEAALDVLLQGRTAILIAHRLTTAMKADRIVVVNDGRIVETGSHEQLVAGGGLYAGMYETWVSHAEGQAV